MKAERCTGCSKLEKVERNSERLDKIVRAVTLGNIALETEINTGLKDELSGEFFFGTPALRVIETRKPVYVSDLSKCIHTERRFVRLK